jgi:hypothetical protein
MRRLGITLMISCLAAMSGTALLPAPSADAAPATWVVTPSPNVTSIDGLFDVSCIAPTSCVAVGYNISPAGLDQTLIESRQGPDWAVQLSPDQGGGNNYLYGVSCTTSTSCVAVGNDVNDSDVSQTLIESWDGSSWSIVSSPNQGSGNNSLSNVFCLATNACTAVGAYVNGSGAQQTLIESWDGTSWSIVSSPNPGTGNDYLDGVVCTNLTFCVAEGAAGPQTLVESWDGTSWTATPSPNQGTGPNELTMVSCTSPTNCVAVGDWESSSVPFIFQTLIESWDGSSWSIVSSPNQGNSNNGLSGVSCVSPSDCVASGEYRNSAGMDQSLIESWDGTTWSVTPTPDQGIWPNDPQAISCTSDSDCTSVGYFATDNEGDDATLVETGYIPGPPASIAAISGTPQTAPIDTTFPSALQVIVDDQNGNPVPGVTVTFTAPTSGASGSFAGDQNTAVTDSSGVATSASFAANDSAGSYSVAASAAGVAEGATFSLTNLGPASIVAVAGTTQSARINRTFQDGLEVFVEDANGQGVPGVTVTFTAPTSGASGTFAGNQNTAVTDSYGDADSSAFTANGTAGSYSVLATVAGVANPASFSLTNLPLPPVIKSFSPLEGKVGTKVEIKGTNLGGATQVAFNGVSAVIKTDTPLKIVTTVPSAATSGAISVTTPGGKSTSGAKFKVT